MTVEQDQQQEPVKIETLPKSIAIIGGGASGSIILDCLVKVGEFSTIKLFERRNQVGGVWVLDENPSKLDVPPGKNQEELDPKIEISNDIDNLEVSSESTSNKKFVKAKRSKQERFIHTAAYEGLTTNIPESLMTFSDEKSWGKNISVFNQHYHYGSDIDKYLKRYAGRNIDKIQFNSTVEDVYKDYSKKGSKFVLTIREETDEVDDNNESIDKWYKEEFDAIIVATGHYNVPFIPDVPGLKEIYEKFPSKVTHSKTFRISNLDEYKDKVVIVVGTRSSGVDIAEIVSQQGGAKFVYQSQRRKDTAIRSVSSDTKNYQIKPIIKSYELINDGKDIIVNFEDGSVITNPDKIVYATGYRFSYPFLKSLYPNFTTGYIIPDLYQHTFSTKDPLLSVIGVPTDAISFRAFEYQAVLVSRFLAGKVSLPSVQEQNDWCSQRFAEKGDTRAYHSIESNKKLEYLETLTQLGGGVEPINGKGRPFPTFSEKDLEFFNQLKERFEKFFAETLTINSDQ